MLADAPDAKPPTRTPEFVVYGAEPPAVMGAIAAQQKTRYFLCVLIDDDTDLPRTVAVYKAYGHRFLGKEPLFVLDTSQMIPFETIPVRRIVTAEEAAAVGKAARSRQLLPEHLGEGDRLCRLYAAFEGDLPIGWVRSVRTHPDGAWVAGMFVDAAYRRRGIGRSLLSGMLADDARFGIRWSVLLASATGALLYPHLGYRRQGLLLLFTPAKSR